MCANLSVALALMRLAMEAQVLILYAAKLAGLHSCTRPSEIAAAVSRLRLERDATIEQIRTDFAEQERRYRVAAILGVIRAQRAREDPRCREHADQTPQRFRRSRYRPKRIARSKRSFLRFDLPL
jgi:hypothetical protein